MFIIAKPKTNHRHQLRAGLMGTLPKNTRRHMANNAAENQLPMAGFSGPLPKPDEPAIDPNLSRAEKFNLGIRRGNAIVRGPNSTLAKQFPIVPELVPEVAPEQENVLLPVPEPEPSLISMKVLPAGNYATLFKMLDRKRFDIIVSPSLNGRYQMLQAGVKGLRELSPPIMRFDLFHYLHKKNKALLPRISKVLQSMRESGDLKKIRRHVNIILLKRVEKHLPICDKDYSCFEGKSG